MNHEITTNTFSDGSQLVRHLPRPCLRAVRLIFCWHKKGRSCDHQLTFIKRNRLLSLAMADKDYAPLSTACVRALNDRCDLSKSEVVLYIHRWTVQNVREAKSSCFGDWKDGEGLRLCRQHQPDQKAAQGASANTNTNTAFHKKYNIFILSMMQVLGSEFAISQNPHMRKGGLIGLCVNST